MLFRSTEDRLHKKKICRKAAREPAEAGLWPLIYASAEALLGYFDYFRSDKGKTSGSRVMFINEQHGSILLHKPHPQKELKGYQIKQLIEILEQEGLI